MRESFITWQGKHLFYRHLGEGPTVVLLHGFPFDGRIWLPFAVELARHFRIIIPDLPGFGRSERPDNQLNMNVMAWAVAALLQHLGIDGHVVVGHSMGGYVALELASARMTPNLKGLVLFHSHAGADDDNARSRRNKSIELILADKDNFVHSFVTGLYGSNDIADAKTHLEISLSQDAVSMASAMAGLRDRPEQTSWLPKAHIPLLFILGKADSRMPTESILPQVAQVPHAEVLLLANVGHMGFSEAPQTIMAVLTDYSRRCLSNNNE